MSPWQMRVVSTMFCPVFTESVTSASLLSGQRFSVKQITEAYREHVTTHMWFPICSWGLLHSGLICNLGQKKKKKDQSSTRFRQCDRVCKAPTPTPAPTPSLSADT